MFYLTNNKVEFEGHTFIQIKRERSNGDFELGGYVEENLPKIRGEKLWIGENSYVFGNCVLEGNIRVRKNCVIKNSVLKNAIVVGNNCLIENSELFGDDKLTTVLLENCKVIGQSFKSKGKYEPTYFEDGIIETDVYNGVVLTMTHNYCKVDCLTMTYETAWSYLNNNEKWEFIKSQHPDAPQVYYPDTKKWLYYWCEKQLKRKQGRAK